MKHKKKPSITAGELLKQLNADPSFRARSAAVEQRQKENRAEYTRAAAPLLSELNERGFRVVTLGELRAMGRYELAMPLLLEWLPKIAHSGVKNDLIRALSVNWAPPETASVLISEFHKIGPSRIPDFRWILADALAVVANDAVYEE